jgi:rod shape determining protein RodA
MLFIPLLGLITLYSAGYQTESSYRLLGIPYLEVKSGAFHRQGFYFFVSLFVVSFCCLVPIEIIRKAGGLLYLLSVGLLVLVALFGTVVNGSRRWLSIGGWNLQPAELVKVAVIVCVAISLSRLKFKKRGYGFIDLIIPMSILIIPVGLIIQQPDLGTALSVGAGGGIMLLFMGIDRRVLLLTVLVSGTALVPLWNQLHTYQKNRILALLYPDSDPQGTGYHIAQSKIAIGSGELFGKGFMQGTQSQLEFLPEHTTDFIFSVLAEEWGFVGCATVIACYFLLFVRLLTIATRAKDLFGSLLVIGIAGTIFFHVVVNMGMVMGILPVVGIPLSLFSYGGSSFISTMFLLGLVLRVSIESKEECMFSFSSTRFSVTRLLVLSTLLSGWSWVAMAEDNSNYLLPKDFQPFDKEEFKSAYTEDRPWDMRALVHDIRLGDLSQRSIWAGTEKKFNIVNEVRLSLAQQLIKEDKVFGRKPDFVTPLSIRFSPVRAIVEGVDFVDVRFRGGGFIHLHSHSTQHALDLKDGSKLFMIFPQHRRPDRQGATLMCYRPFYSQVKIKNKKVVEATSDRHAFFADLSYALSYEVSGRYITGDRMGVGKLLVLASPEFYSGVIDEDSVESANPYLEIDGEKEGGIKTVNFNGKSQLRSEVVAGVRFEMKGGRSGTFLHHKVVDIIPANDEMEWVGEEIKKIGIADVPNLDNSECVYYVYYQVEREIYGEGKDLVVGVE